MRRTITTIGAAVALLALCGCAGIPVSEQPSAMDVWAVSTSEPGEIDACTDDEAVEAAVTPSVVPPICATPSRHGWAERGDADRSSSACAMRSTAAR